MTDAAPITQRSPVSAVSTASEAESIARPKQGCWLDLAEDLVVECETPTTEEISTVAVPEQNNLGGWLQQQVLVGRRHLTPATPILGVPPYPGFFRVPRVPAAPKLKAAMSNFTIAATVAEAYVCACKAKFGRAGWGWRSKGNTTPLSENQHYLLLIKTGRAMRDADISPYAWCGFSCDSWRSWQASGSLQYVAAGTPPRLAWVLSEQRLIERREEFRSTEQGFSGGQLRVPEELKLLVRDYLSMIREINTGASPASAVAARWFPQWDQRVERVQEACDRERVKIQQELERNLWLWG